ncbi:M14 family zinc carboxypeptidase [Streptomyces sp. NRRL F-5123]|uniref:M14 family zinc carboxypeptidase n=1 Tax=Streptomyces sp. NRRL F-5123 TaxID=1463856 RepID=UPI0006944696|nr:M14 family zinc carboxypeptidase [Streptomyces sp. NRRL F-5123]
MIDASTSAGRAIAAYDRYPALDEIEDTARTLAARHPRVCRTRTVGASRAGRPLTLLSVGEAADHVLVVSGAHPDELVGGAAAMELAHRILADPAQHASVAWHFLLCADPDGARLVHGAHRARDLEGFLSHYFRPASGEQPEWAPSIGGRLPESDILLGLIGELRPFLQFSLHGIDVGGTFVQSTREIPGLAGPFTRSAAEFGIPVECGSYDTVLYPELAPGVYLMPPPAPPATPFPPAALTDGARTGDIRRTTWYAPHRHGGATVIVEAPRWACDRKSDRNPGRDPQRRLAACADRMRRRGDLIAALLDAAPARLPGPGGNGGTADGEGDGPLVRSVRTQLAFLRRLPDDWDPRCGGPGPVPPGRRLTEGLLAGLEQWTHRVPLRAAAMLRRAVAPAGPAAAPLTARLDMLLHDWTARYRTTFPATRLPVARQAAHQAGVVQAAVALSRPGALPAAAGERASDTP